ncbi:MAG: glycosyltransferase, partial [Anaerolineae bacterium]|nr:glycosyltransferase [Anaerolineae bacterium]
MRILCLTSRLPYPPNRGDRLRAFHFIEHLSQEHDLSLVSFIADEAERDHLPALRAYCHDVRVLPMSPGRSAISTALNIWRREPLQALYYRLGAMRRMVDDMIATTDFQAAYVHLFRMAPYIADHAQLYRIVDLTDVISKEIDLSLPYRHPASRAVYLLERKRINRYEQWVAQHFEETWLISNSDGQALAQAAPRANIRIVPNGIDFDQFYPTGQSCVPDSLIFVGHLSVLHNMDAATHLAQDVLPLVQREVPSCTLNIVGADPAPRIRQLGQSAAITVTGFVPDLNAHLNNAAVFAAPLRFAAGIQNKVLEAMAAGRPVVTTSLVNDGLGAQPEREILVADDPTATAQQIV